MVGCITDFTDMNYGSCWWEAWCAAVHEVTESTHQATELNWREGRGFSDGWFITDEWTYSEAFGVSTEEPGWQALNNQQACSLHRQSFQRAVMMALFLWVSNYASPAIVYVRRAPAGTERVTRRSNTTAGFSKRFSCLLDILLQMTTNILFRIVVPALTSYLSLSRIPQFYGYSK